MANGHNYSLSCDTQRNLFNYFSIIKYTGPMVFEESRKQHNFLKEKKFLLLKKKKYFEGHSRFYLKFGGLTYWHFGLRVQLINGGKKTTYRSPTQYTPLISHFILNAALNQLIIPYKHCMKNPLFIIPIKKNLEICYLLCLGDNLLILSKFDCPTSDLLRTKWETMSVLCFDSYGLFIYFLFLFF